MSCRRLVWPSLILALLVASHGIASAGPRAVLELFTSQGCSSCPPADELLGEYAKDPSVIALSLPIDIWDYLGWKDTLALPGHSALQRAYAHVRGDREVYTPQIIVNGSMHALGSDRTAIEHEIAETDRDPAVMSLSVQALAAGRELVVTVKRNAGPPVQSEVWLCPLASAIEVAIGRGENHGQSITYHNVVRGWRKLGEFTGADATWNVPLSDLAKTGIDAAVVMVQEGTREKPGALLGAALTKLPRSVDAHHASAHD